MFKNLLKKRAFRYRIKLFAVAFVCIWTLIGSFAWLQYTRDRFSKKREIMGRVDLAAGRIVDSWNQNSGDLIDSYIDFLDRYYEGTALGSMSLAVYNLNTGELINSIGTITSERPVDFDKSDVDTLRDGSTAILLDDTSFPSGEKVFYYYSRISPGKGLEVRAYLPLTPELNRYLYSSDWLFWAMILVVGVIGTVFVYLITAHQAKNISLLHEFAHRAANDRDFIPMGEFPSDELGDISRQIISIYNSRMQANQRREREHVIALKANEEKNRMKRVLTNNISHELKTPIGIIKAYVEMLVTQDDMPEEDRRHFLLKTQENVDRIVAMLNDLSTMTRLEESGQKIPMKAIDFHDMIFNFAEEIKTTNFIGDMEFEYDIPDDCVVRGNEGLLLSVLNNLVKNAKAYSQGTRMGIALFGRKEKSYTFVFYDNGTGVAPEHIPHLFERFYRIDSGRSRKSGGTGLGLPIVKSAVNSMGGGISVRNRRGGGLEFLFTLQRIAPGQKPDASAGAGEVRAAASQAEAGVGGEAFSSDDPNN
ncbi:MAG: HAMP domain-containing histidine kinase [Muribaculaceae bacterium]|nr:HAMP domain-containing histidine kinase [Muribaculaceae bacterium]